MIFELSQDFHDAVAAMPREHPKLRIPSLLEVAIRRGTDSGFRVEWLNDQAVKCRPTSIHQGAGA